MLSNSIFIANSQWTFGSLNKPINYLKKEVLNTLNYRFIIQKKLILFLYNILYILFYEEKEN